MRTRHADVADKKQYVFQLRLSDPDDGSRNGNRNGSRNGKRNVLRFIE